MEVAILVIKGSYGGSEDFDKIWELRKMRGDGEEVN